MKWREIFPLLLVILAACFLAACAPGGSSNFKIHCSDGGEVCINISTVQSFAVGDPVALKITVTSSKDLPDLHITLHIPGDVTIDGPKSWENNLTNTSVEPNYAGWNFPIKAGQPLTFTRVLHFPINGGYLDVGAEAITPGRTMVATDIFSVVITGGVGQVFRAGTPQPRITPNITSAVYYAGTQAPTFCCATNTPTPALVTNRTATRLGPLTASSTPLPPYPPPPSPSPSPTPHAYP